MSLDVTVLPRRCSRNERKSVKRLIQKDDGRSIPYNNVRNVSMIHLSSLRLSKG